MSRRDHDAGFSLTEAVAALAVTALFVLMMSAMSGLVAKNSQAMAHKADEVEQLATGLSAIRRDMEAAMWVEAGTDGARFVLFDGKRSRIAFAVSGHPDLFVTLQAVPVSGGSAIMRSSAKLMPGMKDFGTSRGVVEQVLHGPWRVEFAFAQVSATAGLEWLAEWSPGQARLPAAVRLRFFHTGSEALALADLTVPVRANSPPCSTESCKNDAARME